MTSMSFGRLRERLWNNNNVTERSYYPLYCTWLRHGRCIACENATHHHDETSAVNHEDQMAGQNDNHKSSHAGRTPFYGTPPHQEESQLDRTTFEDAN